MPAEIAQENDDLVPTRRKQRNSLNMKCMCLQGSWYPCSPHFLSRISLQAGGLGTKTLTWEERADSGRHTIQQKTWPAKRSWLQERDWQTETGRQSNLSASVSVSQFLFFQPAFLPATTWQPHEQISSHSNALKKS